jgi:hypothetical protein
MVEAGNRTNVHVKTLIDEQGFGESPTRGINSVVADFAQDLELDTQQGATEFHNCISKSNNGDFLRYTEELDGRAASGVSGVALRREVR